MPPDISATARPLIPTGSPPCPGCPPVNTNTSCWSTSTKISVSGCFRLTGSPCAACTSRPMMTASSDDVTGNRLSRRRGRTANAPLVSLVSAIAAAIVASGVFGTSIARQTRTMPGTSLTRSATRSTALACSASVRCLALHAEHDHPLAQQQLHGQLGVPHRRLDVALQQPLELLPVAALEHDFAKFEQHARLADGLLRRPGYRGGIGNGHPSSLPASAALGSSRHN